MIYETFKQACNARGLLGNVQEWYNAFDEAASWATSSQLRQLFVTMLLFCEATDEYTFFSKVWRLLSGDIQYQFRETIGNPAFYLPEKDLKDFLLDDLSELFLKNGSRIEDFNLPKKIGSSHRSSGNCLVDEELSYNTSELLLESETLMASLNNEQLEAFYSITETVLNNKPGFFFVSGYGGTGKTYLWNAVISYIRAHQLQLLLPVLLLCSCLVVELLIQDSKYHVI